jgi:proliferating cell nuclear antigen
MSETVVEGIVPAQRLQTFVDVLTRIVDEAKINFGDEGVTARAVDPANVCMVGPLRLEPSGFESYDAPGSVTIGVNLTRLNDVLDLADAGDLVHLAIDMETRVLRIEYGPVEQKIALIDPDTVREEPEIPDLDLPNTIHLAGSRLDEASNVVELVSDHIAFECDTDGSVDIWAEGDVDESHYRLGPDELLAGSEITDATYSLFSLGYVADLVKPMPDTAEITVRLGDEFPMELAWETCEGHLSVDQQLAPRIESS